MPAPRYNVNVSMPEERLFQLRQLADELGGATMSETIKALFAAARAQGLIKDHTIPGVTINALPDGIAIAFDQGTHFALNFDGARDLASTVRQFAIGKNNVPIINLDHDFAVQRKGRGIIVTIAFSGSSQEKAWNADLAIEFSELIEGAIKNKITK